MIKVLGCQDEVLAINCLAGEHGLSCETVIVGDFIGGPVTLHDWETGEQYSVIAPGKTDYNSDKLILLVGSSEKLSIPH
ncbi:MAG: hypothetical protein ACRCVX_11400 [Shewanella sp.]